jgi:hypothetical protein
MDELIKINERITDELIKHYARTVPQNNAAVVDEPLGKEWVWLSPKLSSSNGSQLYYFNFSFDRKTGKVLSLWTVTGLKEAR